MNRSLSRAAPIRFLIGVLLVWTTGRGMMLMGWQPPAAPDRHQAPGKVSRTTLRRAAPVSQALVDIPIPRLDGIAEIDTRRTISLGQAAFQPQAPNAPISNELESRAEPGTSVARTGGASRSADAFGLTLAASLAPTRHQSRLSGSAWAFIRGGERATALSPGGQIGGGQAGTRLLYRLDSAGHLSASGRISTTFDGIHQTEAAIGFDWAPVTKLPLHLMLDRRIAIDKGGRTAWTAGVAGGVYAVPVAKDWRLDGYGEAGVVGVRRRDLYADGAVRIARAIELGGGTSLAIGGGLWGAAQPGTERLDIGPSAVLRLPVSSKTIAVALDWRERIGGKARPGSGAALTIATDF